MEQWQFLIQKQGDRTWRPLESPKGEILAGRYRVLARSHRPNTDVEVRVTFLSTQEVPPKRRIHKRSRRTNSDGLMAVIPYTNLKPGIWELQCSGDLMSDILGESWKYTIYLQVLPQPVAEAVETLAVEESQVANSPTQSDTIAEENLVSTAAAAPDISVDTTTTVTADSPRAELQTPEDGLIDQPVSPVWLKGETAEQILQQLIELALPTSEPLLEDDNPEKSVATFTAPPLGLTLDQETYVAHWGEALVIHGRVYLTQTTYPQTCSSLELTIDLRSPVQSEILTKIRQPLPDQQLPFTISSPILIPAECQSQLILADISLSGAFTDIGDVILLASQSFTITADVTQLLAMTAAKPSTDNLLDEENTELAPPTAEEPQPTVSLGLELFNLVKSIKPNQTLLLNPSPNKPLPPQLNRRALKAASLEASTLNTSGNSRAPQLPNFPRLPTVAVAEPPTTAADVEPEEAIAPIDLDQLVIRQRRLPMMGSTFPYLKQLAPSSEAEVLSTETPDDEFDTLDVNIIESNNIPKNIVDTLLSLPEPVVEVTPEQRSKLIANYVAEVTTPPPTELIDESVAEVTPPPPTESITSHNPYSSPLIKKWLHNQGFSLPQPIHVAEEDYHNDFPVQQTIQQPQQPVADSRETPTVESDLPPLNLDAVTVIHQEMEAKTRENLQPESPLPVPPPPPRHHLKTPSAWLAQEIVVEDTYIEPEPPEEPEPTVSDVASSLGMIAGILESLPIPQMLVPEGELIAGKLVRVRMQLPDVSPEVVIKLWVKDCQTRWLIDGPHILKMLNSPFGGLEVITQLNIPFGCLEIRIEAIALNTATLQESHKVSITRTVIPPNLPKLQIDELLGI